MSGHVPTPRDAEPCESPPPPYSAVAAHPTMQDKEGAYPSAPPGWMYPPTSDYSQGIPQQPSGYPSQGYVQPPVFVSQPGGQYGPPPTSGYGSAYIHQPGAYVTSPQQTTVVSQQPLLATTVIQPFREVPVHTVCPKCQASVVTETIYETGTLSWLLCAILCLIGCDAGCCFIPFCVDSCKDIVHVCPNCHQSISRFNRL